MGERKMAGSDILSRIQILLDADTANFEQGMQDAQNTSESSFKKIRESANMMGGMVVGAASVAIGSLLSMATAHAESAQQIELNAYKAQATTTEFQKMAVGAAQMGIEADELADIFKDFNEKLGEMVTVGAGGGVDFFEQVAIKTEGGAEGALKLAQAMAELSGPQAMQLYVDKMEEANLSQDQMSFLMESMGSEATMLIPLLRNGGEGLKLWADAAERAGIIMSEETIASAAELRVQTQLLDMQLQGAKNQLMQAVIPAFVGIADAFFGGSTEGAIFEGAAEGIAETLKWLAKIAIGATTVFKVLGQSIGAIAASGSAIMNAAEGGLRTPAEWLTALIGAKSSLEQNLSFFSEDLNVTLDDASSRINSINSGASSDAIKNLAKLRSSTAELGNQKAATTAGIQDFIDANTESANASAKTTNALEKQQQVLERLQQERYAIEYENADRIKKMQIDLYKDVERVKAAMFAPESEASIIKMYDRRASIEKALWLEQYDFDLSEFKITELEKLTWQHRMNEMSIELDRDLSDEQKALKRRALVDQHNNEVELYKNAKQQELLELQRYHLTELEFIRQSEALKREEIEKTLGIDDAERQTRLSSLSIDTQVQVDSVKTDAFDDLRSLQSELSGTQDYDALQSQFDSRMQVLRDNLAAENITWDQFLDERSKILEAYNTAEASLNIGHAESMTGSVLDILESTAGKQSGIYKTMFAVNKAFAIAQSMISITSGIAQAAANPFPKNLVAMASVAAATASLISNIQSVKLTLDGQAHDGIDKVPEDGTWLLQKNERVTTAKTSAKLDKTLDEVRQKQSNGFGDVIVNNYGADVQHQRNAEGDLEFDVRVQKVIDRYVPDQISTFGSKIHKSIVKSTTASSKRAGV